jgi:hypothetical protein
MDLSKCMDACAASHRACMQTAVHCLQQGGEHATRDHIRLLWDCSDICGTSANLLSRGSPFHQETCRACATICTACAETCERIPDDPIMARCAALCRESARLCREMSAHHKAA